MNKPIFYYILRVFITDRPNHSVQYFYADEYESIEKMQYDILARYFNILSADLQNSDCIYNACYLICGNNGNVEEHRVFDRRPIPEPEPEPDPEEI